MLRCSTSCLSRIPDIGHQTSAKVKWATYTFWYILDPLLRRHHWYYRRKVQLDRALEKNSVLTNCAIGIVTGATLFLTIVSGTLLPKPIGSEEHTMRENAEYVIALMGEDSKELPAYQLMRVKREIIGKLYAVADVAEVRRQREEVARMQAMLDSVQTSEAPITTVTN